MKKLKLSLFVLLTIILISSIQVGTSRAQDDYQIYLPLMYRTKVTTPTSFGVNFHISAFEQSSLSLAAQANSYWVRYNGLLWSTVQPDDSNQWLWGNYSSLDEDLAAASRAGMEIILVIRSTPEWARDHENFCGPMDNARIVDFANFMYQVVDKYSAPPYNVKYYEIWNEPDAPRDLVSRSTTQYGCWGDPYDPSGFFGGGYYGQVLKAVYPQVKAASGGQAQVVLGGLLLPIDPEQYPKWVHPPVYKGGELIEPDWPYSDQSKFFEGILQECLAQNCFDYVNYHGFTFYGGLGSTGLQQEENEWFWSDRGGQVEGKLNFLKSLMAKYGIPDKPILLTETGLPLSDSETWNTWDSAQRATYEAAKADYLVYSYTRNMARGITGTTWYHFDKWGWNRGGLLDSNSNPLPAYDSYKVLASTLQGAVYHGDLSLSAGMRGFDFKKSSFRLWVLFSEDGQTKTINLPPKFIRAYNLFGSPINPVNNQIKYNRPIYIEFYP